MFVAGFSNTRAWRVGAVVPSAYGSDDDVAVTETQPCDATRATRWYDGCSAFELRGAGCHLAQDGDTS